MSRKKKKPSGHQRKKLAVAQYKNEFFRRFRSIFNIFCDEKLFDQIPSLVLENLYNYRSRYIRLISTKEKYVTNAILEKFKIDLTHLHKNVYIKLNNIDTEISIYDFFTAGLSVKIFEHLLKDDEFPGAKEIKAGLEKFTIDGELDFEVRKRLVTTCESTTIWYNDIAKCQYWLNYETTVEDKSGKGYYQKLYLHSLLPQSKSITINGSARPAILFEWTQPIIGPVCVSIKPSSLNIDSPFAEIPMKVYIQKHALQRFAERMDGVNIGFIQYFMYHSFTKVKVFYDTHNNLLIEYRYDNKRAGYFRVDIVEGIILVRTFLFITNSGTPEGQLREKNTGLQKLDKKYLAMDKLSTYMTSDIGNNKELRKRIVESGCQSLIELYEIVKEITVKKGQCISEKLLMEYLKKEF